MVSLLKQCKLVNLIKPELLEIHFRHVGLDDYPYSHYPTHCQGLFYLLDIHVTSKLINLFEIEYHRNYVWIEDVFITGTNNYKNISTIKNCDFFVHITFRDLTLFK